MSDSNERESHWAVRDSKEEEEREASLVWGEKKKKKIKAFWLGPTSLQQPEPVGGLRLEY